MRIKSRLLTNLSVYTIFGIIQKLIPFIVLPLLTHYLSPEDFGKIAIFVAFRAFISPFLGIGSLSSIDRYYFDRNEIRFEKFLSSTLYFFFGTVFLIWVLLFLSRDFISQILVLDQTVYAQALLASVGFNLHRVNQSLARMQERKMRFILLNIFESIIYSGCMLTFVIIFDYDWYAEVISQMIVFSLLGIFAIYSFNKQHYLVLDFDAELLRLSVLFGFPVFLHTLGLFFVNMTDKILLMHYTSASVTGIYAIAFKFGAIISFVGTSLNLAFAPWLFKNLKEKRFDYAMQITLLILLGLTLFLTIISLFLPIVARWILDNSFESALPVMLLIGIAEIPNLYYVILVNYIFYSKKTKYIPFITFVSSILSIVLNFILIQEMSIYGAVITLFVVYLTKFILTAIVLKHLYKVKFLHYIHSLPAFVKSVVRAE